jgi:membrane protease YdiL (CAAX protease family)
LLVLVIWMVVVFGGELLKVSGTTTLDALVSDDVVVSLVLAPLILLIVVAYFKWWYPAGLKGPDKWPDMRLLWLPVVILILIWMVADSSGLPEGRAFWFIMINTLLVGISEELMFRGILFFGAASRFNWERAVWISALVFGLVHALNGLITGSIGAALLQALLASLFGVWTVALRLRLNTIIPLIILHWLWDFGVFSLSAPGGVTTIFSAGLPILFAIILFLYGLWLLEGYRNSDTKILIAG